MAKLFVVLCVRVDNVFDGIQCLITNGVEGRNDICAALRNQVREHGRDAAEVVNCACVVNDAVEDVLKDSLGIVVTERLTLQVNLDVCGGHVVLCACCEGY